MEDIILEEIGGENTSQQQGAPVIPEGGSQQDTPSTPSGSDAGTQTPSGGTNTPDAGTQQQKPVDTPDKNTDQLTDSQRAIVLKEIFGESFKSVDEVKQANIPSILSEVKGLRETKQTLEEQLSKKPKTQFVSDKLALFNEFVRETNIDDYGVFSKINSDNLDSMDPMQALVTKFVIEHPSKAGNEDLIRRSLEIKYGIKNYTAEELEEDPELSKQQELNKFNMETDADDAKKTLLEIKSKLKLPEPEQEPEAPKGWTPEQKEENTKNWGEVSQKFSEGLAKFEVPIRGKEEAFLSYELSEDDTKRISDFVLSYAVENQMELTEANVQALGKIAYSEVLMDKLPDIVHSVFEKTRNMTQEDRDAMYENPSARSLVNNDKPDGGGQSEKTLDDISDDIIRAELGI